jgi:hypothetical protein
MFPSGIKGLSLKTVINYREFNKMSNVKREKLWGYKEVQAIQ